MLNNKIIISLIIFLNFLSFFIGFFFFEEHGASALDSKEHTYPAIEGLRQNFVNNIISFGKYGEHSYPFHHIIFAYLNPFEVGSFFFRLTSICWSFLILILLFKIIKDRFNFKYLEILFLSSLILLSPYFRTSAFWGMTENTGLLFLLLSIHFYNRFKNDVNLISLCFICIFSSLALYSRLQYLFICLFFFSELLISISNKKRIILIITYCLLSIPALVLIYYWGGLIDEQHVGEFSSVINFITLPRTILVIFSLIGFYSLPFLICLISSYKTLLKEYGVRYLIALLGCLFIFYTFNIDILSLNQNRDYAYGQGFIANYFYKLTNIQESYLLLSALGFCVLIYLFDTLKNKILIITLIFVLSFRVHFFTEYLDPLLFVLTLCLLDIKSIKKITKLKNIIIMELFFILTLFGAILL